MAQTRQIATCLRWAQNRLLLPVSDRKLGHSLRGGAFTVTALSKNAVTSSECQTVPGQTATSPCNAAVKPPPIMTPLQYAAAVACCRSCAGHRTPAGFRKASGFLPGFLKPLVCTFEQFTRAARNASMMKTTCEQYCCSSSFLVIKGTQSSNCTNSSAHFMAAT